MTQKIVDQAIIMAAKHLRERMTYAEQPFFIFDMDSALARLGELEVACRQYFPNAIIAVSLKSCSLGLFLRLVAERGLSAEICSGDELQVVLDTGFTGDRIVLEGPYKSTKDLVRAITEKVLIHVDSAHELKSLIKLAVDTGQPVCLGIRLSHFYEGRQRSRFGVTIDEFQNEVAPLLSSCKNIDLKGFQLHIESNLASPKKVIENLRDWLPFLVKNMPSGGYLDVGSGFSADSSSLDASAITMKPHEFFQEIFNVLSEYDASLPIKWRLIVDPSRYLSEDHGYLVGRAMCIKNRDQTQIIQTNLGINGTSSVRRWHHSLVSLDDTQTVSGETVQMLMGVNGFENDCLFAQGRYGLREDQWFIIRGCSVYDLQAANEWTRIKPPIYALYKGNILTARLAGNSLPAGRVDLLHAEKVINVDKNIQLTPACSKYAGELFEILEHNRDEFRKYLAWTDYVTTEYDEAVFLDKCLLAHQKNEEKTYVILHDGAAVGILSFNSIDSGNKTAYIGYWLDVRAQGQGIITKSMKALIQTYAESDKIKRFVLKCSVHNMRSNAVAQRCGFTFEGKLRKAELLNGVFYDQNIYSLIV
ncbi:GNAT family N-acetyltransferase [Bartonella massiliensis]|uniref:GNAT family N-acetyltransferase n=1 Tax=Bartonella massiliensis TaxID=929795 RepID=UPI00115B0519|nr:GNAT family N-acetyltransferase [Bartonella massiliensis]